MIITKRDFQHCLADHPEMSYSLIRARQVRALTERVKSLALMDVYGRIARTLLQLAQEKDGKLVIEQRLTHQDIANMVGASREMASRIFKDLTGGGYLSIKNKTIMINEELPPGWKMIRRASAHAFPTPASIFH